MPLYEYYCNNCNHKFEKLQGMNAAGSDCPVCEAPARRSISVFASVSKGGQSESSATPPAPMHGGGGCCGGGRCC